MKLIKKVTEVNFSKGFLYLLFTGFVSTILSISIDLTGYELGALINYFWPGFLTLLTIIAFGICCLVVRNIKVRLWTLIVLCAYLLYVGIALHFEKDYWPLVTW